MNSHENFSLIVTWLKPQRKYSASQNESKWKFQWCKLPTVVFSQYIHDL